MRHWGITNDLASSHVNAGKWGRAFLKARSGPSTNTPATQRLVARRLNSIPRNGPSLYLRFAATGL
jgi:hypothetical protein